MMKRQNLNSIFIALLGTKAPTKEVLTDAQQITDRLIALRNDRQRNILMRFFKTGVVEYGEGDEFLGIKVPVIRGGVKMVDKNLPLAETEQLLLSPWHEVTDGCFVRWESTSVWISYATSSINMPSRCQEPCSAMP